MTDPSHLSELLERAVPVPPSLAGLAARAETDARRARTRRRTAFGAAALVVVAVGASFAVESRTPAPVTGETTAPQASAAVPCRPETLGTRPADGAVSVRFCSLGERTRYRQALVPDVALVQDVPTVLAALETTIDPGLTTSCFGGRNPYSIQVGYADGSAYDLRTAPCGDDFEVLLEAIGRQEAPVVEPDAPALACPARVPKADSSALFGPDPVPAVRRLPAVAALQCSRRVGVETSRPVPDPEALRADLLSSYRAGMVDCGLNPGGIVTTWVLRLADGSVHTARVDGRACSPLTIDTTYVGLAGERLGTRVAG